ncbi:hypothetical protein N9D63_03155 [Opitutales bacterium]|jgi:hypothetical protein|nr:hypothetical protein [Opitutales bacterium]
MVSAQRPSPHLLLLAVTAFLFGCGDDTGEEEPPPVEPGSPAFKGPSTPPIPVAPVARPIVYVEELDQFQEYFKEQHDTSFSHTRNKNYCSFTAGKVGMPMRIALYGKPHFATSDFYGSSMSGVLREGNPERGRKIAKWSLSRDDVVSQLATQGLSEIDYGWIDIKFQEIAGPLEIGKKYFVVCERIADGKHFFGAFSFGEGNPYAGGRHWLHPEHDLVFRSYVGNEEKPALEGTESNATEPPGPKGISISPSVPTVQYSEDKKNVVPPLTPVPTPPSPVVPAPSPPVAPATPEPPAVPPGPPQPRLRSVIPLEKGHSEEIVFPSETGGLEGTNPLPLPPSLPKANEANATGDSNKTKRRGLLPGLFPRK